MTLRYLFLFLTLGTASLASAQSKTTNALQEKYSDALSLFFYNNTLRMINQKEDKAFDELIKDIEKMKFLMIKKSDGDLNASEYKKLVSDYKAESFEEAMTSRHNGKNFDIYVKEGNSKGMLVLVNDDENLYVLDIVGSIALNQVTKLYNSIDESSEIGKRIRSFANGSDADKKERSPRENHP
jgi:hypothetical protein